MFGRASCERTGPDRLVGPFQKILAEDHMYYNYYAIESAFKKAMNLDTMKPQWKSGGDLSQLKRKSGKAQV
jgi:hypothetical protein